MNLGSHEVLAINDDNEVNVTHLLHRDIDDAWEFCLLLAKRRSLNLSRCWYWGDTWCVAPSQDASGK